MRTLVFLSVLLCNFPPGLAEEVQVKFDGDEEVIVEQGEEEVVFEEEEEAPEAQVAAVAPEPEISTWLLVLPLVCLGLLAINVRWRKK